MLCHTSCHGSKPAAVQNVFRQCSQTQSDFLGSPLGTHELDLMILAGPFQLRIFYDSMISVIDQIKHLHSFAAQGFWARIFLKCCKRILFIYNSSLGRSKQCFQISSVLGCCVFALYLKKKKRAYKDEHTDLLITLSVSVCVREISGNCCVKWC